MFKKVKFLFISIISIIFVMTCTFDLPKDLVNSSKSSSGSEESKLTKNWDPYIGVHPFSCGPEGQQKHLLKLIEAGILQGIRLWNLDAPDTQEFALWFIANGVEVLGTIDNEYLKSPNLCQIFEQHILQNPEIITWEIGNEVTGFIDMQPEEYMERFKKLFYFTKQNYPHIILASEGIAGNGNAADLLRRMIDSGLNELCKDGLQIVAIHFYSWKSLRLEEFKSQIDRIPISTRIWVTETNLMPPKWLKQIDYVVEMYPKIRNSLRAERIYWYVFAEGKDFHNGEYSLVKGLAGEPPIEYSPLMKALIKDSSNATND